MNLREEQVELSFCPVPFGEAVASRAVQQQMTAPVALSSHKACRTGCREELRRRTKVGRMGIAGNLD